MLDAAALEEKDFARTLELLLATWQGEPGTALADLIDAVSRRASEGLPSLRKKPAASQWAAPSTSSGSSTSEELAPHPSPLPASQGEGVRGSYRRG